MSLTDIRLELLDYFQLIPDLILQTMIGVSQLKPILFCGFKLKLLSLNIFKFGIFPKI